MFVSLASLTTAVIEGPHSGWTSWTIVGLFVTAGAALALFLFYEPRRKDPLVDLRFFYSIPFSSATLLALCAFASIPAFFFSMRCTCNRHADSQLSIPASARCPWPS